ncbi:TPA: hypothetical protein ACQ488_004925 [Citrobacter freundii]
MTTNHPAHGPVSLDRLHQISETLSKAAAQSDGGNLGYAMADAVKVIDGVLSIPSTLPCPVHLETGLKFGKGVRTQCVLDALRRRADYYAELEAMTPEQRSEHDAGISEFKAILCTPAPVVPKEMYWKDAPVEGSTIAAAYATGWNACRAAMLQAGNSPVIGIDLASEPDRSVEVRYLAPPGYVIVPIVPTEDMIINGFESVPDPHFSDEKEWEEYEALSGCRQAARRAELCWAAMIKAAPKQENI